MKEQQSNLTEIEKETLNNDEDILVLNLSLARITFLSTEDKKKLLKNLDSSRSLALLSIEEIENLVGHPVSKKAAWNGNENLHMAQVAFYYCKKLNIQILLYADEDYPEILRQIHNPPFVLFYRGNISILKERSVSVVGTRRLTPCGKEGALSFGYNAVMDGCNVVSGLANGADAFAHKGAVNACFDFLEKKQEFPENKVIGKTIAVLPSAIDEIVPYGNRTLAENILKTGGLLVSEYEPGCQMAAWHFVERNRIIAGLSPATVVIQAPPGSGALITADFAVESNRDLMFHNACFDTLALQVSEKVKAELDAGFSKGKVSKFKRENTVEKYLEAGAPVIKDYKDYCVCFGESPGIRNSNAGSKGSQGDLFEQA